MTRQEEEHSRGISLFPIVVVRKRETVCLGSGTSTLVLGVFFFSSLAQYPLQLLSACLYKMFLFLF